MPQGNIGAANQNFVPNMAGNMAARGAQQIAGQAVTHVHKIGAKAKFAAVMGILLVGIVAFLNIYVSGPEETLQAFCDACNQGNMNEMLDCMDETSEKTIRGTVDIAMGVVDSALGLAGLDGLGISGDTMIDMMPSIWGLAGMDGEIPHISVSDVQVRYEGNEFLDFLKTVHLDLDGFYKVFAKEAEVDATLEIEGESERLTIEMENENWGKWKINLSDWLMKNM